MKPKKCKICGDKYQPTRPLQVVCGYDCAIKLSSRQKEKKEKKELKQIKDSLLTKADYIKMLQQVFNAFIRERDKDLPCISCGTTANIKYDAGHFYPTTYSFLRFHEDNVHKQCSKSCNMEKHGNISEYRPRLIERIGLAKVQWLDENRHKRLDLSIPELQEFIKIYKLMLKQLRNNSKNTCKKT